MSELSGLSELLPEWVDMMDITKEAYSPDWLDDFDYGLTISTLLILDAMHQHIAQLEGRRCETCCMGKQRSDGRYYCYIHLTECAMNGFDAWETKDDA